MAGFEGFGLFDPDLQDETGGGEEDDIFLSAAEILDKVREHSKSGKKLNVRCKIQKWEIFLVIGRVCDFIGFNFFFAKKTFKPVFRIRDVLIGIRIQDPRVRIVRSESCSLLVHRRIRIRTNNYGSRSG
jgi:hypothetical protein